MEHAFDEITGLMMGESADFIRAEHYGLVPAGKIVKRACRETVDRGHALWVVVEGDVDSGLPPDWCRVLDPAAQIGET